MLTKILSALHGQRFNLEVEKVLQSQISDRLTEAGIAHQREYQLSKGDIIDFYFEEHGIGLEIKIKGDKKSIFKQVCRYCLQGKIVSIILVTNKSIGLPDHINTKPVKILNLGRAWL